MISAGGINSVASYYQKSMQAAKKSDTVVKAKELIEKIMGVDWDKVLGETEGIRFDFSV